MAGRFARAQLFGVGLGGDRHPLLFADSEQVVVHTMRVDRPCAGLFGHQAQDELLERSGASGANLRTGGAGSFRCFKKKLGMSGASKGSWPVSISKKMMPMRVEIGRRPGVDARDALGGHVLGRSEDLALPGEPRVLHRARDTEVEQLDEIGAVAARGR